MLKKIREIYLSQAFDKNKRRRKFLSMNSIESVIIFFDLKDLAEVVFIIQDLEKKGKKVLAWTSDQELPSNEKKLVFKKIKTIKAEDYSNLFILKKNIVDEFNKLKYDTLIDLRQKRDLYIDYLLAINKAVFCIGTRKFPKNIYNLIIIREKGKSVFENYETIRKYISMIKN